MMDNPSIDELEDLRMREILAVNLSYLLVKNGETQARVAEKTGISTSALNSYMKGKRYPRPGQLNALAKYFHVSVGELTDDPTEVDNKTNLSNEAKQIAYSFDELDAHGKELVRIIIHSELQRIRDGEQG